MTDMFAKYLELVDGAYQDKKLSRSYYESLINRNEIDLHELFQEMKYAIDNAPYYFLFDRIAKAEIAIADETDMKKKDYYIRVMKGLCDQMERLQPLPFEPTKSELEAME